MVEGAKAATGVAVIIDVFRACSVEAYLMARGAERILPVGDMQAAYEYKNEHPDALLVGERKGRILPDFDYGNSPSQLECADVAGKSVVHTTSAGTQGIVNAKHAEMILTGSLVNAAATAEYIRNRFEDVSLVCMGLGGKCQTEEDNLCAYYIKSLLEGRPMELRGEIEKLKTSSGAKFFDPAQQDVFPKRDFFLCTDVDRFPFVLKLEKEYIRKIEL